MQITVKTPPCPQCCGRKPQDAELVCQSQAGLACQCGFPPFTGQTNPPRFYRKRTKVGSMLLRNFGNATCAGGSPTPVGYSCRTRGGTASLIGFSEFTTPSSPPKKYRAKTYSGRHDRCNFTSFAYCLAGTPINGSDARVFALSCQYNKTTGVLTTTGVNTEYQNLFAACPATVFLSSSNSCTESLSTTGQFDHTTTPQTMSEFVVAQCALQALVYSTVSTSAVIHLSDEDLETDAIDRLLSGAGGTWSSWTPTGDGTGGTCVPASCCLARHQIRTTGFDFVYQEAQFQISQTGLLANTAYAVQIDLWRRTYNTGSFVFWKTIVAIGTTDEDGVLLIDEQTVENERGFETYAKTVYLDTSDLSHVADSWAYSGEYALPSCVLVPTDGSTRYVNGVPSGMPDVADYAGLDNVAVDATSQVFVGTGSCVQTGGSSSSLLTGTMTDTLSEEDTIGDAIARALGSMGWSGSGCVSSIQNRNLGEACFGVTKARVQAIFRKLTIGQNYTGTIVFVGRVAGSADPWGPYGQQVISFTATATEETTAWVDVPLVNGMEIKADYGYAVPA